MTRLPLLIALTAALLLGPVSQAAAASACSRPDGSRAGMTTPGGTFAYGYDGIGRSASLTDPWSATTGWSYDAVSRESGQTLPNGITTVPTYNAADQLTRLVNANATPSTLSDFGGTGGVTHDGAGNTLTVPASVTGVTALTGTNSYTLDSLNRLTAESSTRDGGYSEANVFDGAGNPTTLRGTSGLGYNADNQISTDTFDGSGNPSTYKSTTTAYDSDSELTAYGSALTASYDVFGMRAWKQNSSSVRTYFLYDGAQPVCELNSSGTVTAVNTFGANGLISRATISGGTPTPTYYTFDTTGSVAQRTDASGAVTSSDLSLRQLPALA